MKMKRLFITLTAAVMLMGAFAVSASALDYSFDGVEPPEYYGSTDYEGIYGSEYNYGEINAVDYDVPELPYGSHSGTSIGVMEKAYPLDAQPSVGGGAVAVDYPSGTGFEPSYGYIAYTPTAFTSVADMERRDGSIGTISIPALSITYKVWEGETSASMSKGLAHYSSTSGWDGNVGICGHNRGSKYVIGAIKDLEIGDTITYTTVYGTRTYSITTVATILNNDWSYLDATSDNRITITTCLANRPAYRVCVQAVEVQ